MDDTAKSSDRKQLVKEIDRQKVHIERLPEQERDLARARLRVLERKLAALPE
jgi:hypothetical protein